MRQAIDLTNEDHGRYQATICYILYLTVLEIWNEFIANESA